MAPADPETRNRVALGVLMTENDRVPDGWQDELHDPYDGATSANSLCAGGLNPATCDCTRFDTRSIYSESTADFLCRLQDVN